MTDAKAVSSVIEKFQKKYGVEDVKKYYSKFDVAVSVELGRKSSRLNRVANDDKECPRPVELGQIQDQLVSW